MNYIVVFMNPEEGRSHFNIFTYDTGARAFAKEKMKEGFTVVYVAKIEAHAEIQYSLVNVNTDAF